MRIFSLATVVFTTFHPNWLIAFALDSIVFYSCLIIFGNYHPGRPETK